MSEATPHRRRHLYVEYLDDWALIDFADTKILDEQNIQSMGEELFAVAETNNRVVLNLATVEFLSSAALGKLITFQRMLHRAGGQMILCAVRPDIQEVFQITKLDKFVHIAASVSAALPMLQSRLVAIACPWEGCGHEIVDSLITLIEEGYAVRCPSCESKFKLAMTSGLEGKEARIAAFQIPTFEKHVLRVSASGGGRHPTGPFSVQLSGVCELYVADAIERLMRTLPAPRQVILNVAALKELTPKAVKRLTSLAQELTAGEAFVALFKAGDDPPPFDWPPSIPLFKQLKEARDACAAAGPPMPVVVPLRHL